MTIKLYGAALSPFVRKIRVILREKGLTCEHIHVDPAKKPEDYHHLNPLGRIPALVDGDLTLADSGVISAYLDAKYPETVLRPSAPEALAKALWFEKFGDYELAPLCTFTVFRERVLAPLRGMAVNEEAVQAALNHKLPPLFDYLEQQVPTDADTFIAGDHLSVGDIALATQFANLGYGGESVDGSRWPRLAAYAARILARHSFQPLVAEEQALADKLRTRSAH